MEGLAGNEKHVRFQSKDNGKPLGESHLGADSERDNHMQETMGDKPTGGGRGMSPELILLCTMVLG